MQKLLLLVMSCIIVIHSANGMCTPPENATSNPSVQLLRAAQDGKLKLVRKLLKFGANVNQIDKNGSTPLHFAARDNDLGYPIIIELLNKRAMIDKQNSEGNTPLHTAAKYCDQKKIGLLLRRGANANIKNKMGRIPLHEVIINKPSSVYCAVATLLKYKDLDVNALDNEGKSSLQIAVESGQNNIVGLLMKHRRIDIETINMNDISLNSVFYNSTVCHHEKILCLLLLGNKNTRINVNEKCPNVLHHCCNGPQSILAKAIKEGWGKVVELLLRHPNININVSCICGRTPLHEAIRNNCHEAIIAQLLTLGANINAQDHIGSTPLHEAVIRDKKQIVLTLLQFPKININVRDCQGNTPLHLAYLHDYEDCAELLLKHPKIAVNAKNNDGKTPLDIAKEHSVITSENKDKKLLAAAGSGNMHKVEALLQNGANINCKNQCHRTPLHMAVNKGLKQVVKLLLNQPDVNVNIIGGVLHERTPLLIAIKKRNAAIVKLLLNHPKTLVNLVNDFTYETPLHFATKKGLKIIVGLLLTHPQIHIDNVDYCYRTPLSHAIELGFADVADLLLHAGAKTDRLDDYLKEAAHNGYTDVARVLLQHGATINPQNTDSKTALEIATDEGYDEVAQLLKEWSLDGQTTQQTRSNHSVNPLNRIDLSNAVRQRDRDTVELLLKNGAPIAEENYYDHKTALHYAVEESDLEIVKLLLSYKANVNAQHKAGSTPLHITVENSCQEIAELLIQQPKIDVNLQDENGCTPLHHAVRRNSHEIIKILMKHPCINVNIKSETGETALHWAIYRSYEHSNGNCTSAEEATIRLLFNAKNINVNLLDNDGKTPAQLALEENNVKAFNLIQEWLASQKTNNKALETCSELHRRNVFNEADQE